MPRPARPWFRFYSEALQSRKAQKLKPSMFKHWVNLLCLANIQEDRGRLPSIADIAFAFRTTDDAAHDLIEEFVTLGFVDGEGDGFVMHEWDDWQKDSDARSSEGRRKADVSPQNRRTIAAESPHIRGGIAAESPPRGRGEVEVDKEKEGEVEVDRDAINAPDLSPVPSSSKITTLPTSAPDLSRKWGWDGIRYAYETNVGALDTAERSALRIYWEQMQENWIMAAINETQSAEKPCFKYFAGIMQRCIEQNRPPSSLAKAR